MASYFIEEDVKQGGSDFSKFFHEALTSKGDPWNGTARETSAVKKAFWYNKHITPLHCACINPNVGPLEALFKANPDVNISDSDSRKLVHYAAACQDIGPLRFLIDKGANLLDTDKQGQTPLLIASKVGRAECADYLIEKIAKMYDDVLMDEIMIKKYGKGGVNRPGKDSWCPLHVAVAHHQPEVVKILFKHGANPDKQLSSNYDKVVYNLIYDSVYKIHL